MILNSFIKSAPAHMHVNNFVSWDVNIVDIILVAKLLIRVLRSFVMWGVIKASPATMEAFDNVCITFSLSFTLSFIVFWC